jgi:hypothetical protein
MIADEFPDRVLGAPGQINVVVNGGQLIRVDRFNFFLEKQPAGRVNLPQNHITPAISVCQFTFCSTGSGGSSGAGFSGAVSDAVLFREKGIQ